jgi:hypothetical protein
MGKGYRCVRCFVHFEGMGHTKEVGGNTNIMLESAMRIILATAIMGEANRAPAPPREYRR